MNNSGTIEVFIVEDDPVFGLMIEEKLGEDDELNLVRFESGQAFIERLPEVTDIAILDYNLPEGNGLELLKQIKNSNRETDVILISSQQDVQVVVNAYKEGAKKYIVKDEHALTELRQTVELIKEHKKLKKEVQVLRAQLADRSKYDELIGESPALLKALKLIQKVENNDITVLITGESGTGKELVARAIHANSRRRKKPFVAVNMAAIPDELAESELFGHEKGAFTGARGRRIGKFEEANGGTIFLDEIGDVDMNLQSKLLRVLQDNKITRLGSNKEIKLNLRTIAASNKDLSGLVPQGAFREDLYYRISGFLIHMPPLRERNNDIILLAKYFLDKFGKSNGLPVKTISKSAIETLIRHKWPGNVRELKSVIERAMLIAEGNEITSEDILFS